MRSFTGPLLQWFGVQCIVTLVENFFYFERQSYITLTLLGPAWNFCPCSYTEMKIVMQQISYPNENNINVFDTLF